MKQSVWQVITGCKNNLLDYHPCPILADILEKMASRPPVYPALCDVTNAWYRAIYILSLKSYPAVMV